MNRCAQCFTSTDTPGAAFVCVGSCEVQKDDNASTVLGVEISSRPVIEAEPAPDDRRRRRPTSAVCEICKTRTELEVCRRCHQIIPPGWRDLNTTCLVLAGARTSGKSVYIAVLVHQLRLAARRSRWTFEPLDDTTAQEYKRRYEDPLFDDQRMMDATRAADQRTRVALPVPLIFRIGTPNGVGSHLLVLRDLPGENLEKGLDSDIFGMCARSDGVVFLIDPFQVKIIREMLTEVIPEQLEIGADAKLVLGNFTRLLRRTRPSGRIEIPIAVVLSKFDALQGLREVHDTQWSPIMKHAGAAFQRDPSSAQITYDRTDADLLQAEVHSLLYLLGADELLTTLSANYQRAQLFAVSALGHAPSGARLHTSGIAPFRVLDPVKWLLDLSGLGRLTA